MESPNVYMTRKIWKQLSPELRKALLKEFTYDVFDNRILWSIAEDMWTAEKLGTKGAGKLLNWLDMEVGNIVARQSGLLHGDTIMPMQFLQQEFEVNKTADYWNATVHIAREAQRILRREGIIPRTHTVSGYGGREAPAGDEGTFEVLFTVFDPKRKTDRYPYKGSILAFVLYDYPKEGRILIESIAFTSFESVQYMP